MKTWNPIKPTLCGAIVAAGAFSFSVQAADEALIELIPADALIMMHAADATKLPERLKASPLGQTWINPKFQKFIAPGVEKLKGGGELDAMTTAMKKAMETFDGEMVVSVNSLPFEVFAMVMEEAQDFDSVDLEVKERFTDLLAEEMRMVMVGKVPGNGKAFTETWSQLIEDVMEETKEEGDKYEMTEVVTNGQTIYVARETPAKMAKSYDVLAYAQVGEIGIVGSPRKAVEETIDAIKKGVAGAKLTDGAFGTFHKKSPDNDVHFHVNLSPMIAIGKAAALKAEKDGLLGEQAAGMGVTIEKIWGALGLADLQSLDLSMKFDDEATEIDSGLLFAKRSGLMNLIAYKNGPMPKTPFIPQDVGSASISLFSFEGMYKSLLGMLDSVMPAMMPMVKAQLAGAEGQLGVSIEKDLLGNLKPEIITLQSMGADGQQVMQDEMVIMAGLKNEQGFEVAFDKVLAFASGLTGIAFEPSEFLGHKLHTFEAPGMAPGAPTKISYLFTKGYFVLSIGKGELLRKVLSNIERPGKSLWDVAHVKSALAQFEPGYCEVNYINAAQLMTAMTNMLSQFPQAEMSEVVDWDHKLSENEWRALLGFAVSAGYMEKNGFFGKGILLPNDK